MNGYAWLWAWACISLTLGKVYWKVTTEEVTECRPMESTEQSSHGMASYTATSATSEIKCAIRCAQKGAQQYFFGDEDGVCILVGEGMAYDPRGTTFVNPALPEMMEDIATGKTAYGSRQLENWAPELAVDDKEDDSSMYHSGDGENYPWWVLDLNEVRVVYEVQILPRQVCCQDRFRSVKVRVGNVLGTDGNFSSYKAFSTYDGPYDLSQKRISCVRLDGVAGRYISIQQMTFDDNPLQLLDVNVIVKKLV